MTGSWQELPIDIGTDIEKLSDRFTANDKITNSFWALYDSLCITADQDNQGAVLISDYTEANQTNDGNIADFIQLNPKGELQLPVITIVAIISYFLTYKVFSDIRLPPVT